MNFWLVKNLACVHYALKKITSQTQTKQSGIKFQLFGIFGVQPSFLGFTQEILGCFGIVLRWTQLNWSHDENDTVALLKASSWASGDDKACTTGLM